MTEPINPIDTGQITVILGTAEDGEALCDRVEAEYQEAARHAIETLAATRARAILQRRRSEPPTVRRILVVDDDLSTCRAVSRLLADIDPEPEVDFAVSVAVARAKLAEQRYHVLVVDWKLANGYSGDVIEAARRALPLSWVILMSGGLTGEDGPRMARSLDANDWLSKPFHADNLLYTVRKGLGLFDDPRGPKVEKKGEYRMLGGKPSLTETIIASRKRKGRE